MATWQPPIPSGALYSKPARDLGPALALLAYCYDLVQRDGWLDIVLKDAATDMEEPYQNMKRWWSLLREGPFFAEAIDRGKKGWRVRFKDVWIDWRILKARPVKDFSSTDEVPQTILENPETPHTNGQVQIKYKSSTNDGSEMVLEQSMYKEDQHDQKTRSSAQKKSADSRANRPPSSEHQRLMQLYAEVLPDKRIPNGGAEGRAAKAILAAGYKPEEAIQVYKYLKAQDFYAYQNVSLQTVNKQMGAALAALKNGHTPSRNGRTAPEPARPIMPAANASSIAPDARSPEETARRARELMAARKAGRS
jgi:hypothetical protein